MHWRDKLNAKYSNKEMKLNNDETFELLKDSLGFRVNYLAKLMRSELEFRLQSFGISSTQWTVLVALLQEDMISQRDVAERVTLDNATTTRVLDVLEARGFISRNRTDDDRRVQIIALSDVGREFALEAAKCGEEINLAALESLTPEQKTSLIEIIEKLTIRVESIALERSNFDSNDQIRDRFQVR